MFAAIILSLIGIAAIFILGRFAEKHADGKPNREFRKQAIYQPLALVTALVLYGIHRVLNPDALKLSIFGDFSVPAQHLSIFGISETTPWKDAVLFIALAMFVVTTVVVFLQIIKSGGMKWGYPPIAFLASLLPSLTNSLTEEIVFRFIAIEGLSATHAAATIAILCGVWFGLPHYFGSPGKIPGVFMAGFLGWIIAWATIETSGIGAAWFIHFVQDVPIFTIIFLNQRMALKS